MRFISILPVFLLLTQPLSRPATQFVSPPTVQTAPSSQSADLILTNGNFITLRPPGDRAQAVAITGSLIIATGDTAFIRQYTGPSTKIIDLHGATVVPGFNDVHQHPFPVYSWDKPYATHRLGYAFGLSHLSL